MLIICPCLFFQDILAEKKLQFLETLLGLIILSICLPNILLKFNSLAVRELVMFKRGSGSLAVVVFGVKMEGKNISKTL